MANISSSTCVFNNAVPAFDKGDLIETKFWLEVNIRLVANALSCGSQDVLITLTKKDDACFLYVLRITDAVFQSLAREDPSLFKDFLRFPSQLIDLLQTVVEEDRKPSPVFRVDFSSELRQQNAQGGRLLEIIEKHASRCGSVKDISQCRLRFPLASEEQLKQHFLETIDSMREKIAALEMSDSLSKRRLQDAQEAVSAATSDTLSLRSELSTKIAALNAQHQRELHAEKERWSSKSAKQQSELEQHYKKQLRALESRLKEITEENSQLKSDSNRNKELVAEYRGRVETNETEIRDLQFHVKELERDLTVAQRKIVECEKDRNQVETQYNTVVQELQDSEGLVHRTKEMYRMLLEQKRRLEDHLQQTEGKIRQAIEIKDELVNGATIISKLNEKIALLQAKADMRGKVAIEQEKAIGEKDVALNELRNSLKTLQEENIGAAKEKEKLAAEVSELQQTIKKNDQLIQDKQSGILKAHYLSKQLNDLHLGRARSNALPLASTSASSGTDLNAFGFKPVLSQASAEQQSSLVAMSPPKPIPLAVSFNAFPPTGLAAGLSATVGNSGQLQQNPQRQQHHHVRFASEVGKEKNPGFDYYKTSAPKQVLNCMSGTSNATSQKGSQMFSQQQSNVGSTAKTNFAASRVASNAASVSAISKAGFK